MTRLTIATSGDPLTFRPVTSSIRRQTKDGPVDVIILFHGTDYNISMDGIIQQNNNENADPALSTIGVDASNLVVATKAAAGKIGESVTRGSFSSFMYFYPKCKIIGHIALDSNIFTLPLPTVVGQYEFTDLLTNDKLKFVVRLTEEGVIFQLIETVDGSDSVIYTETPSVDGIYFEFDYLINGRSSFHTFENYNNIDQVSTRKWVGNLNARLGECTIACECTSTDDTIRSLVSDHLFINYSEIFMRYDREYEQRFIGRVIMYDTLNAENEEDWQRVRSRDYKFIGDRVIENGIIRLIIRTNNPVIEVWGWNYNEFNRWERAFTILPKSDFDDISSKIQNINFEYFNGLQLKCNVNFGTSNYSFILSKGDPYITMFNKSQIKFYVITGKNRFAGDYVSGNYSKENSFTQGNPSIRSLTRETIEGIDSNDNWFCFYNNDSDNEVVGWISNVINPTKIDVEYNGDDLEYDFTYPGRGNIFGIGVLPSFPTNLAGNVPFPLVVNKQDEYVKWRANEALLAFKELETFTRR